MSCSTEFGCPLTVNDWLLIESISLGSEKFIGSTGTGTWSRLYDSPAVKIESELVLQVEATLKIMFYKCKKKILALLQDLCSTLQTKNWGSICLCLAWETIMLVLIYWVARLSCFRTGGHFSYSKWDYHEAEVYSMYCDFQPVCMSEAGWRETDGWIETCTAYDRGLNWNCNVIL